MNTQFKKGVLEICVLKLLNTQDRYGYELVSTISKTISITEGTIYPLLKRLRDSGYVETYLKESVEGPSRKYYKLTKEGRKMYQKMFVEWEDFVEEVNAFLYAEDEE
jgi:PadR family transcriptional regulator PadR